MKRKTIFSVALVAVLVTAALIFSRTQLQARIPTAQLNGTPISDDQVQQTALAQAIKIAKLYGMESDQPTEYVIKQTTLAEFNALIQWTPGPDAAKFDLDPNRPIWIVSMLANGTITGPGYLPADGKRPKFDNITIALRADTLQDSGVYIAAEDQPLGLGLQRK